MIAAAEHAGPLQRPEIGHVFHHADHMWIAALIAADGAGRWLSRLPQISQVASPLPLRSSPPPKAPATGRASSATPRRRGAPNAGPSPEAWPGVESTARFRNRPPSGIGAVRRFGRDLHAPRRAPPRSPRRENDPAPRARSAPASRFRCAPPWRSFSCPPAWAGRARWRWRRPAQAGPVAQFLLQIARQAARRARAGPEFQPSRFQLHQMHVVLYMHFEHRRAVFLRQQRNVFQAAQGRRAFAGRRGRHVERGRAFGS